MSGKRTRRRKARPRGKAWGFHDQTVAKSSSTSSTSTSGASQQSAPSSPSADSNS